MPAMSRLMLILFAFCWAGEARAEWRRAETANFVIQGDLTASELRGYATRLEALDLLLRRLTGVTAQPGRRRAEILVVANVAEARKNPELHDFEGGANLIVPLGPLVVVAREYDAENRGYDVDRAFFHEYAHAFMRRFLSYPQPGWYIEGFATYFESAKFSPDGRMQHGGFPLEIAGAFNAERSVPFREVMAVSNNRFIARPTISIYATGWVLTHHYLFQAPRSAEIGRYLAAVKAGRPVDDPDSFFAGGVAALDRDMTAYVKALPPPREIVLGPVDPARVSIRPMRPAEVALARRRLADIGLGADPDITDTREKAKLRAAYDAARALRDQYPGERELSLYTMRLAQFAGEYATAETIADTLLAAEPNNPELLALKANAITSLAPRDKPAQFSAAILRGRALIQRAQAIEPDNPAAAEALYRNFFAEQGGTPVTRRHLQRAVLLNPDSITIRMKAVELATRARDYAGAIALLEPSANSPHDTPLRRFAQSMIASLRRQASAAPVKPGRWSPPPMVVVPSVLTVPRPPPVPAPAPVQTQPQVPAPPQPAALPDEAPRKNAPKRKSPS